MGNFLKILDHFFVLHVITSISFVVARVLCVAGQRGLILGFRKYWNSSTLTLSAHFHGTFRRHRGVRLQLTQENIEW